MNLQEQIFRSRKLMVENNEDKISLVEDLLNQYLNFDNQIDYKVVEEHFGSKDEFYFSVEATIDSSMYHKISPKYNEKYHDFINRLDDKIYQLVDRYFADIASFEVVAYKHKNVEYVIDLAKPMLDKAFKVYSKMYGLPILPYKFISTFMRSELVIFIDKKDKTFMFTHSNFVNVLGDLFHDELGYNLFDDFYITGMVEVLSSKGDKIYESVVDGNVVCDNCGWSWKLSEGGDDPFTCHKCGTTTNN
jgi:hypothetical protein